MKSSKIILVLFVIGNFYISYSQNWLTGGNILTTGNEFIGSNVGSTNPNITFKRNGQFAGQVCASSISLGINSFQNTLQSGNGSHGTTAIGSLAGQFNYNGSGQNGLYNTYIGYRAGRGSASTNLASNNVFVGADAGINVANGDLNVFIGQGSGYNIAQGSSNVFIGRSSGYGTSSAVNNVEIDNNVIIGAEAGVTNEGEGNTYIGTSSGKGFETTPITNFGKNNTYLGKQSGQRTINSEWNTYLGTQCGFNMISGSYNTFIGRVSLPNAPSDANTPGNDTSNTIILADGTSRQRLYIHSNGFTGIGLLNNTIPQNMLEVKSAATNSSGLRLTNLPNTNFNALTADATPKVLSVNADGDVILVDDKQAINPAGTLSTTCNTANFITKSVDTTGNLTCSQIFDNGTSVGIGTTSNFGYVYSPGDFTAGTVQLSGTVTLDVAGVTRSTGFYATSDKKFKKDINPIESALDKIMSLEGKTYNWRKDEFKDKNFTSELQYGLLAQDVQKVIPSLVIESENGDLAMNYTGLIPVLIEALKEQQAQISELKQQLTDNFKAQNQDLLQFSNTKIISVSPNPSNDKISVSLNIEKEVQSAALQVHDINGNVLSNLNLKERANNVTKTLQKDNFGKGIYIVSLVINGKSIDSKKIVFN